MCVGQGFKKITSDSIDLKQGHSRRSASRTMARFERLLEELTKRRYQAVVVLPRSTPDVEKPVDLPKPSVQSPDVSLTVQQLVSSSHQVCVLLI